jgi:hypothetical protein
MRRVADERCLCSRHRGSKCAPAFAGEITGTGASTPIRSGVAASNGLVGPGAPVSGPKPSRRGIAKRGLTALATEAGEGDLRGAR